jgi:hypothetical protein
MHEALILRIKDVSSVSHVLVTDTTLIFNHIYSLTLLSISMCVSVSAVSNFASVHVIMPGGKRISSYLYM